MNNTYNFETCFLRKKVTDPSVIVLYTHINWLPKASLFDLAQEFTKHEKDKLYLFKDQLLRYEYAYTHYLLRQIIIRYCSISYENLKFYFSNDEKPKSNKVKFNLSHSHGYIAFIFSNHVEVGIDIQQHQQLDKKELQAITDSLFSKQEIQQLRTVLYEEGEFYRIWTQKESYGKALGKGLVYATRNTYIDSSNHRVMDALNEQPLAWMCKTERINEEATISYTYQLSGKEDM